MLNPVLQYIATNADIHPGANAAMVITLGILIEGVDRGSDLRDSIYIIEKKDRNMIDFTYHQYGKNSGRNYIAHVHWCRERKAALRLFNEEVYVTNDSSFPGQCANVYRYTSNKRIPPKDILDCWFDLDLITPADHNEMVQRREEEQQKAIDEYIDRENNRKAGLHPDVLAEQEAERQFELRAAFGPGEKIVNCLTGEVTYT